MNYIIVALSVIIIVILFYVAFKSYFSKTTLMQQTSLADTAKPVPDVIATNLQKPNATRYAYGVWIYVNTLNASTSKSVIFSRDKDIAVYLDQSTSTLYAVLNPDTRGISKVNGSMVVSSEETLAPSNGNATKIAITNNFHYRNGCILQ